MYGTKSEYVNCTLGLKQGCGASPIMFDFFIDELSKQLENSCQHGLQLYPYLTELFLLMFADDIALMSDTVIGLQREINTLEQFCNENKLTVNEKKTKIVVFKKGGKLARSEKWLYKGCYLECVSSFHYVGLLLTRQMSMPMMVNDLAVKAKRVLYGILSNLYKCGQIPRKAYFKIFDSKTCAQLLYGSELWGFERHESLERIQYYACKRFMCADKRSCNAVALGDCDRYPLHIETMKRGLKYWFKLLKMEDKRYPKQCYIMLKNEDAYGKINWVTQLRSCLQINGFGYVWESQNVNNENVFINSFVTRARDQYLQNWRSKIDNSSKLSHYRQYKSVYEFEYYLEIITIRKFRRAMSCLRNGSHSLHVDKYRRNNVLYPDMLCNLCDAQAIEDEYHFVMHCTCYASLRNHYIPLKYCNPISYNRFILLMSSKNESVIKSLATYIYYAFERRKRCLV